MCGLSCLQLIQKVHVAASYSSTRQFVRNSQNLRKLKNFWNYKEIVFCRSEIKSFKIL